MNSFAGVFWLFLAQSQNQFFAEHLPSDCLCALLERKRMKKMKYCFYCTQYDILLCAIAKFCRGKKNKLRTFQSQKWKKKKKRTASLKQNLLVLIKKECILQNHRQICAHLHLSFITLARSFLWFLSPTTIHFYYLSKVSATSKQLSAL